MTEKIKKGDFVEIDYTGSTRETKIVFDSTNAEIAKKEGFFSEKVKYGPIIICVGQNQILKGLDDSLEGQEIGTDIEIKLPAERAFGKKSTAYLKLVPLSAFRKNKMQPHVGLQITIEGMVGIVKSIGSGRVIVDFNHPLAGQDIIYKARIHRKVVDLSEKVKSFIAMSLNVDPKNVEVSLKEGKPTIKMPKGIPKGLLDRVGEKLITAIPELKGELFEHS